MTDYEFAKKIIQQLDDEDRIIVMKRAVQHGFIVKGFSRKPHAAPKSFIMKCMGLKSWEGYQYEIVLETIKQMAEDDGDNVFYNMVKLWMEDESSHEEIAEKLSFYLESAASADREVEQEADRQEVLADDRDSRIEQLERELAQARERGRQQKAAIKENKITVGKLRENVGKLEKTIRQMQKKIDTMEEERGKLAEERDALAGKKKLLESELKDAQRQTEELLERIEVLQQYKDRAPKVLCIKQKKGDIEIVGYDIVTIHKWDKNVEEELKNRRFTQIWLVNKGFTYACVDRIKNFYSSEDIKEYLNEDRLMASMRLEDN